MNEKKQKILLTAMKLFSKQSFHQTSMQQIAEACSMSKGSLYTHFKSKEKLLFHIFSYYYQLLDERLAMAKEEDDTPREAFVREIAVHIQHHCEFQEFFIMQMNEVRGLEDGSLNRYIYEENTRLLQRTEKRMIDVFGEKAVPYALDLTVSLKGLLTSYMRSVWEEGSSCNFHTLADFLFIQLEAAAHSLIKKKAKPFFTSTPSREYANWREKTPHPLHTVRKMKEAAIAAQEGDLIIESINILETELRQIKPRPALIEGMIRNLKESENISALAGKLEETIGKYSKRL
ncbi:TetR/AcrR family transcriptional regulator [Bacillus thermotolerans]|uniref:TetR family transcriptional regulator probably coupled to RND multidrug efflux transporter n=1 Tax=Bacillus thermotolerans TaxID=1221996 RepID=A0A0F5ICM9_BACTR|nr:TetR/AcrR family transcriptional regulator [Bacillus thermotolerans]KKB33986.1 TetR family transcriptional regulator probably coupled to RND multidrug efflux transporter [Bacillus thermotolerans]KKB34804.1 TetR family transcriptional regulator probably coupled to RND multidrug efflux transporter [Bacillus thermotolerans]KKB43344.1 TetR family transcriptional regulator probably coupled to RND multidrug efflux transporter [Bacillus thermotolerans]